jgi:hypothetical protein
VVALETQPKTNHCAGLDKYTKISFKSYFVVTLLSLPLRISFPCNKFYGIIARGILTTLPCCYSVMLKARSNTCMTIISPDRSSHGEKRRGDIPWEISCWAALAIAASASFPQRRIHVWPGDAELPRTADLAINATSAR